MGLAAASSATEYGPADRLLHRLALGSRASLEMSLDLEQALYGRRADALGPSQPVMVCGLARAGTTIVMRLLHDSGAFASPTYRDLPFPLSPNAWQRCAGHARQVARRERGHGDGLLHDLDSPEAIEEVFWRCKEGTDYLQPQGLRPHDPHAHTLHAFARYMRLVRLCRRRARYLSKNNNNLLRLPALAQGLGEDVVLVHPFREPLQQAASLLEQHRRACALAQADPFRAQFMGWLGHHEFGPGQRAFLLPGAPAADAPRSNLDYWLAVWNSVHRHLLAQPAPVRACQVFVDYDQAGAQAPALSASLGRRLRIETLSLASFRQAPPHAPDLPVDAQLLGQARQLHAELRERYARLLRT